jgi:hypothetical protein
MQLPPGKKIALTTQHELAVLHHLTIPTNFVDRRPKYYSQASYLLRPQQSFHLYANIRIVHIRNNSRNFIKRLNFLWFLNLVFFIVSFFLFFCPVLLTSPSLFSYHYSYPLHFPSFSCTTIHCSPSTTLSAPSHPFFPPSSPPLPILP